MKAELLGTFGDDLMVVNAARVSMAKWHDAFDQETDTNLICYLAKSGHFSPFTHPKAQFRLEMPFAIARQWERHRVGVTRGYDVFDMNEVSRRYVDDEPTFFMPSEWRSRPDGSIKQGSGVALSDETQEECFYVLYKLHKHALETYQHLLNQGVAPEQARFALPVSAETTWIETGSLYYWSRLCRLRLDSHAQQEIRDLAEEIAVALRGVFPVSWTALLAAGGKHD